MVAVVSVTSRWTNGMLYAHVIFRYAGGVRSGADFAAFAARAADRERPPRARAPARSMHVLLLRRKWIFDPKFHNCTIKCPDEKKALPLRALSCLPREKRILVFSGNSPIDPPLHVSHAQR